MSKVSEFAQSIDIEMFLFIMSYDYHSDLHSFPTRRSSDLYYQDETAQFEYAGEQYQVRYLGAMLDSRARPKLDGQALPLPVVLVRSAEHTLALQVDKLLGSREIVVKTLGVQFSAVTGVSGATVM